MSSGAAPGVDLREQTEQPVASSDDSPAAWTGTRIMHLVPNLHQPGIDLRTLTWQLRATNTVAAAILTTSCALQGLGEAVVIGTRTDEATWVPTAETELRAAANRCLDLSCTPYPV
ncbi:hypothetical protein [Nocardiopsis synnemataformans]|uniref:hypothetical protein n=1 Tax=Nocardiopsis synnemataformans TaxID=61305 RepID=UPI003EBC9959